MRLLHHSPALGGLLLMAAGCSDGRLTQAGSNLVPKDEPPVSAGMVATEKAPPKSTLPEGAPDRPAKRTDSVASSPSASDPSAPLPSHAFAVTDAELAERIVPWIEKTVESSPLPGAQVAVVRQGKQILDRGFGLASVYPKKEMTADTEMEIASVTKLTTTAVVLKLVGEGKLGLEDPICQHLRHCPGSWKPITLRQVLAMESGIPDPPDVMEWHEILRWSERKPLNSTPGFREEYSNTGFLVLAQMVSEKTEEEFIGFTQKNVFDRLVMRSTEMTRIPRPDKLASGYIGADHHFELTAAAPAIATYSSGGLSSTAGDLSRLTEAMFDGTLFPRPLAEEMSRAQSLLAHHQGQAKLGERGLGWDKVVFHDRPRTVVKEGELPGWRSVVVHDLDLDVTVVILANVDHPRVVGLAEKILAEAVR